MPIPAHLIPIFLDCLANLILGLIVLFRNPRQPINISYAAFAFSLFAWSFGIGRFLMSTSVSEAEFWVRSYYFTGTFIASSLFYFAAVFPKGKWLTLKQNIIFLLFVLPTTILTLIPGSLFEQIIVNGSFRDVVLKKGDYLIFTAHFVVFFTAAFLIVFKKLLKAQGVVRDQLRYMFIGILTAVVFGLYFDLFLPWVRNYQQIWLGPPVTIFMVGCIGYAIVRHRLMDIRLVIARSVSYSLLVLVLGLIYAGGLFFIGTYITKQPSSTTNLVTSSLLALIIAFTFQPLLHLFERITDSVFFKDHYVPEQLLKELGKIITSSLGLSQLVVPLLQKLNASMKINHASIVLVNNGRVVWEKTVGDSKPITIDTQQFSKLINVAAGTQEKGEEKVLVFEEMEESPMKDVMRQYSLSVVLPLIVENQLIGAVLLSEKSSGDNYSRDDIEVLKILGSEAAVAVRNALSYEEIKRFNITLREEVERSTVDLKMANHKLRELDQLKDDFVSIASHELRTPMTAIKSYLWMAIYRPDIKLSEKMTKYLSRAYLSTERLINLVNDMLNVSRIESGRIEIRPQEFNMIDLVDDVMQEVGAKAAEKQINLQIIKQTIPSVFADEDKVHQVLLNLIGNSLKFTPINGIITVSFFSDGKVLETSVKDTGVGISDDDQAHLFEKFGRLDNSYVAAATSGGTGLGLYISKSLIELMRGQIKATSPGLGKGATFTFSLPIATTEVLAQVDKFTTKAANGLAKGLEPVAI